MTIAPRHVTRITNAIGFTVFGAYAVYTLSKMPAVGIFLAPTLLMEIGIAISFLIRDEPRIATKSVRARISAYAGSFLMIAFLQIAQRTHPEWFALHLTPLTPVGIALWFAGMVLTAYAVWHLRYCFSIEPAARRLVTSGPYGFARHPIYTGYVIQYLGMLITLPSWPLGVALLVWTAPMIDRMYLEEAVLRAAFPEYAVYQRKVGALGPLPFRRARQQREVASV